MNGYLSDPGVKRREEGKGLIKQAARPHYDTMLVFLNPSPSKDATHRFWLHPASSSSLLSSLTFFLRRLTTRIIHEMRKNGLWESNLYIWLSFGVKTALNIGWCWIVGLDFILKQMIKGLRKSVVFPPSFHPSILPSLSQMNGWMDRWNFLYTHFFNPSTTRGRVLGRIWWFLEAPNWRHSKNECHS